MNGTGFGLGIWVHRSPPFHSHFLPGYMWLVARAPLGYRGTYAVAHQPRHMAIATAVPGSHPATVTGTALLDLCLLNFQLLSGETQSDWAVHSFLKDHDTDV